MAEAQVIVNYYEIMFRDIYQHNLQSFLFYSSASLIAIDKWGLKIFPSADTARNPPSSFTLFTMLVILLSITISSSIESIFTYGVDPS